MTPEQLKTSILLNAIQGKLVEQIDTELCCDIKSTYQGEITDLFDIPTNWKWLAIKDVATINTGLSFKKQDQKTSADGTLRILRGGNVGDDYRYHLYDNDIYVDLLQFKDKYIPLQIGDVITPSVTSMEKMCKTGFIDVELENTTAGGFVYIIRSNNTSVLDSKYLLYFISSSFNKEQCKPNIHKSGQAFYNLKKTGFIEQPICLPPIEEQHRIVAKIEELLPYVDRYAEAYEKLEKFNAKFPEDMKKSILQYAIQGKLVEQRFEEGTAGELYQQIQDEKKKLNREKRTKKEKTRSEITEDEIPFDIPENWKWVRLGDVIYTTEAGKSPNCINQESKDDKWGVIKTTAIQDGFFMCNENKVLPENFEVRPEYIIKKGDFLITRAGPRNRTGVMCVVKDEVSKLILSDKTVRICYPKGLMDPEYMMYALSAPACQKDIETYMTGMASSQVNISQSNMRKFIFPLAPIKEQKRIVIKIKELLQHCTNL